MVYVVNERGGSVAEKAPWLTARAPCLAVLFVVSVRYGTTCDPSGMPILGTAMGTVTLWVAVFNTTMASEPSPLRNAVVSKLLLLVLALMRVAPGRIKRL